MPTFYVSNQLYNPTPPPLSTVLENILPSINTKKNISTGLQSSSGLVQHSTALALSKCLIKFQRVMEKFRDIGLVLGEDDDGQWSGRRLEVKTKVRKRVPEFMVVVAFSHQTPLTNVDNQAHKDCYGCINIACQPWYPRQGLMLESCCRPSRLRLTTQVMETKMSQTPQEGSLESSNFTFWISL